jgi:hypothetical protein
VEHGDLLLNGLLMTSWFLEMPSRREAAMKRTPVLTIRPTLHVALTTSTHTTHIAHAAHDITHNGARTLELPCSLTSRRGAWTARRAART